MFLAEDFLCLVGPGEGCWCLLENVNVRVEKFMFDYVWWKILILCLVENVDI